MGTDRCERRCWEFTRPGRTGYWLGWYDRAGRRHHRRYSSRRLRATARRLIEAELNAWAQPATGAPWYAVLAEYIVALSSRSPEHRDIAAKTLHRFQSWFALARRRPLTNISEVLPADIDSFLAARRKEGVSEHSVARDYRYLRAFFTFAARRGSLAYSPASSVSVPRPPELLPSVPRDEEWLALLRAIPRAALQDAQGWHLLILLAVVTGVRQGALLRVRLGDLDLGGDDTGQLGLLRATQKGARQSLHGLPAEIARRVAARIAALPPGCTHLIGWPAFRTWEWLRLRRVAGFTHRFHALRAASISRLAEAQAVLAARDWAGHTEAATTRRHYLELRRVQLAIAGASRLPDGLPPLPPYLIRRPAKPKGRLGKPDSAAPPG